MQNCVFHLETEASSRERIKTADSKNTNQYARYVVQVAFYNCETTRNRVLLEEFICILCYNLIFNEGAFNTILAARFHAQANDRSHASNERVHCVFH